MTNATPTPRALPSAITTGSASTLLPARRLGLGFDVLVGLKASFDPAGILNPGKLGLPSPFGPSPWS